MTGRTEMSQRPVVFLRCSCGHQVRPEMDSVCGCLPRIYLCTHPALPSRPLPHLSLNSPMFPTFPPALVSRLPLKTARRRAAVSPGVPG
ncbi:selenoprotein W, muscle 1 [Rattus norvegicus]|uniref:Selenoprotein W, muscle 1 n=1 Tax=Rattus norvegicus TaxID=10116 RepID=A6J884_RAT|nr:selenoprotein W, muscle 1 [Rattus norvegicus]